MIEVLGPDAPIPLEVAVPFIVRHWRNEVRYSTEIQFEDGGVWRVDDRVLVETRARSIADLARLFSMRPSAFYFVERNRARYSTRG